MKHYCNRQNVHKKAVYNEPSENSDNIKILKNPPVSNQNEVISSENDAPIYPPGTDYSELNDTPFSSFEDNSVLPDNAQGGAVSQMTGYEKQLDINRTLYGGRTNNSLMPRNTTFFDNANGNFGFNAVPQRMSENFAASVYMNGYIGKRVCLDLWTADGNREELCGIMSDINGEFISIRRETDDCITMIDLKTVRYINIFSR